MKILIACLILHLTTTFVFSQYWFDQNSGTTNTLRTISISRHQVCWMAGDDGEILVSYDLGYNWQSKSFSWDDIFTIEGYNLNSALVAYKSLNTAYIYRTVDGGDAWYNVFSQDSGYIKSIQMVDDNIGYAIGNPVGGKWTILKTSNSGTGWFRILTEPVQNGNELSIRNSFFVLDSNHIWFGTNSGRIYRSTDGGINWYFTDVLPLNIYGLYFKNILSGIAVSDSNVLRTSDGGISWSIINVPGSGVIRSVNIYLENDYILNRGHCLYKSTDDGVTWGQSLEDTTGNFMFISIYNNKTSQESGWTCMDNGKIKGYTIFWDDIKENNNTRSSIFLYSNYPNPFNNYTTMKYHLDRNYNKTILKIYNILGQEVRTFHNLSNLGGDFTVSWNGTDNNGNAISSGVYICVLQADNYFYKKKLLLLK